MRDFSKDHRWLSINTATVRKQGDLLQIIDACARLGIRGLSPWRDQVAHVGLNRAVQAIRAGGFELSGYCRGGFFASDEARHAEVRDDNRRAVDEAKALGAACLVLVVGGLPQFTRPGSAPTKDLYATHALVEDRLGELLDYARDVGVPLGLEPLHPMYAADRGCVNSMRQALDICDRLDPGKSGAIGIAFDVYHNFWDFEVFEQIKRAGRKRLLAFHICDWRVPTRDLLNDRAMMGDGAIDIRRLRAAVEAEGFDGYAETEIFSEDWWARPMDEVLQTCIEGYRTVV
jgi:sugar phosphate isomerase/epimerase